MNVAEALELLEGVTYKPNFRLHAEPQPQFQNTIVLRVEFDVPNSNPEYAPWYDVPVTPVPARDFHVHVADCATPLDLYGKVLACLLEVETHEVREFLGVDGAAYVKPFHPHTSEGMRNWATRRPVVAAQDVTLGVMVHA